MATPSIIVSPRKRAVPIEQDDSTLLWTRRLYVADFAAAATTGNKDIVFPGGLEIVGAYFWLITNFTGGGAGTATLSAGTTADAVAYVAATSVFSGARKIVTGKTLVPGTFLNASTPTDAGTIRFALVGDVNTNLFTAGTVDVYVRFQAVSLRVS